MEFNNRNYNGPSNARGGNNRKDIPCFFFFQFGKCNHEAKCAFSHNPTKAYETKNHPCIFFEKDGNCNLNERCRFSHGGRDNNQSNGHNNNRRGDQNNMQPQEYNPYPPQTREGNMNNHQQYMGNNNYNQGHHQPYQGNMNNDQIPKQHQKKPNYKKNGNKNHMQNPSDNDSNNSDEEDNENYSPKQNYKNAKPNKGNQYNKNQETPKYKNQSNKNQQKPRSKNGSSITKDVKVLVIGATGAGKSSLINLFYVWSQEWKPADFVSGKKVIIKTEHLDGDGTAERNVKNQGESQTDIEKHYTFDLKNKQKGIRYCLNFLDTPGIGDTRGLDRDEDNFNIIMDTVSKTPDLNAILLVMNGAEARISPRVKYIMAKLQGMIPDILSNNLFVLLTNVDLVPNLDINQVLDKKIDADKIFYYNNQLFKLSPQDLQNHNIQRKVDQSFNGSIQTLSTLLEEISNCTVKPTSDFLRIKESRDRLKKKLIECTDADARIYTKKKELQDLAADIADGTLKVADLQKQLNQTVTEEIVQTVSTSYHNTICLSCKNCCHEGCGLEEISQEGSRGFLQCLAFHGSETCQECEHSYTSHVHLREKYVKTEKQVPKIDPSIQQAINNAQNSSAAKNQAKNAIDAEIKELDDELEQHHGEIQHIIDEMKNVCSRFDYMKEIDACINVLNEQIDAVTSDFGTNLDEDSANKLDGLTKTRDKMQKFKDDLVKYLKSSPQASSKPKVPERKKFLGIF